jgi:hypothetical protein
VGGNGVINWKGIEEGVVTPKVPKVPTFLNAIATEHECDPIIDV